ncbi:MAG: McrC family protein [Promethearchaeota archaeon]
MTFSKKNEEVFEYGKFPPIKLSENQFKQVKNDFIDTKYLTLIGKEKSTKGFYTVFLKARYYIGIVKFPNDQNFIIRPKIKDAKFLEMFVWDVDPKKIKIIKVLQKILKDPKSNFLKVLIDNFLYATEKLISSFLRKSYKRRIEQLNVIRGKILISETVKRLAFLNDEGVCNFDTFTIDIFDNQLIKAALFKLRFIALDNKQHIRIRKLLNRLKQVSLKNFNRVELRNIKYDRFNSDYEDVHAYCIMILENFFFSLNLGVSKSFSMLLNSWDIYERFLRKLFEYYLTGYSVQKNLTGIPSWSRKKAIPDIVLKKGNRILLLMDAKYKLRYKSSDWHQAGNYVRIIKDCNCILIYPKNEDSFYELEDIDIEFGVNRSFKVFTHSIDLSRIDDQEYLKNWVKQISDKFLAKK